MGRFLELTRWAFAARGLPDTMESCLTMGVAQLGPMLSAVPPFHRVVLTKNPEASRSISRPARRDFFRRGGAMLASGSLFAAQTNAETRDLASEPTLRVGVIGCGASAQNGLKRLLSLGDEIPNWRVTAIADWFPNAIQRLARTIRSHDARRMPQDVSRFTGPDSALELLSKSDVDLVLIALPPGGQPSRLSQSDVVGAAITTGRSVWCENPCAVDAGQLAQVRQAVSAAREKRLSFHAAFAYLDEERAHVLSQVTRHAIDAPRQSWDLIGEPLGLRYQITHPVRPVSGKRSGKRTQCGDRVQTSADEKQAYLHADVCSEVGGGTLVRHCLPAFVALGTLMNESPKSFLCWGDSHVQASDLSEGRNHRVPPHESAIDLVNADAMVDLVYPNGVDAQVRCLRPSGQQLPRTWLLRGRKGDIDLLHRRWKQVGEDRWIGLASAGSTTFESDPDLTRVLSQPSALARFMLQMGEARVARSESEAAPTVWNDDWDLAARVLEPAISCQAALKA